MMLAKGILTVFTHCIHLHCRTEPDKLKYTAKNMFVSFNILFIYLGISSIYI